jgi:hypothetical protein
MRSLVEELRRREAAAREEAEELRRRIAQTKASGRGRGRLSPLVITRETVDEVPSEAGPQASSAAMTEQTAGRGPVTCLRPGAGGAAMAGGSWAC